MKFRKHLRLIALLIFSTLVSSLGFSQGNSSVTKSPEEQLHYFSNTSGFSNIDLVSGKPDIEVKLYQVDMNEYTLPITLNYDVASLKVEDISGWVGLGWSLLSGMRITRVVKGFPDDIEGNRIGPGIWISKKYGYIKGGGDRLSQFNTFYAQSWRNSYEIVKTMGTAYQFDDNKNGIKVCPDNDGIRGSYFDTEPDEFYLSIPGYNQKFMFNKAGEIKFQPYSNLKIEYAIDDNYSNLAEHAFARCTKGITSFTVYDEQGNKYLFNSPVLTSYWSGSDRWSIYFPGIEGTTPSGFDAGHRQFTCNDEWMLTKIITHKGEEINFNYADQQIAYGAESFKSKRDGETRTYYFSKQVKSEKRLVSIETAKEAVYFNSGLNRTDLVNSKALTSIEVDRKSDGAVAVRNFTFSYDYFESDRNESLAYSSLSSITDDYYKRLKLLSIEESAPGMHPHKYEFAYNEQYTLPNRLSAKKDFWGYFNNSSNNSPNDLFPSILVYPNLSAPDKISVFDYDSDDSGTPYYLFGGYRFPSQGGLVAGACSLNKITFPTGGYHQYELEPNTFFYKNKNFLGGGLRLKREHIYDPLTQQTSSKEYEYTDVNDPSKSSGSIINFPIFAFTENTAGYQTHLSGLAYQVDPYQLVNTIDENYYKYFLSITSEPEWVLGKRERNDVEYKYIKEKNISSEQDNGYTISQYDVQDFKNLLLKNSIYFPNPIPWVTGYTIWVNGTYNSACSSTPLTGENAFDQEFDSHADLRGLDFNKFSVPVCSFSSNYWGEGQLINKSVYNSSNAILSSETYEYQTLKPSAEEESIDGMEIRTFENYKIGKSQNLSALGKGNDNIWFNDFIVYTPYKLYTSNCSVLKKKKVDLYQGATSHLTTTCNYYYNSKGQLQAEELVNSDGLKKQKSYVYPTDLGISSYSGSVNYDAVYDLLQRNQISQPIESTRSIVESGQIHVVSSDLTLYKSVNVAGNILINPASTYQIARAPSSGSFSPLSFSAGALHWDSKYEKRQDVKFSNSGRVEEEQKSDDMPTSCIWDYHSFYPVAEVKNAAITDIGYTSFESDGTGRWTIEGPGLGIGTIADASSFSGTHCFQIGGSARLTFSGMNADKVYTLSYWSKNGAYTVRGLNDGAGGQTVNGWTYYEHTISGSSFIDIYSDYAGYIDEVRLYPKGSRMTTYTYELLTGISGKCDENNRMTYYEYDGFGRLTTIRDQNKNILNKICYNYAGLQENCGDIIYYNVQKSGSFTRTNCGAGYAGGTWTYIVPANTYGSVLSQADADQKAQSDVNINGQNDANIHGQCVAGTIYVKSARENFTTVGDYTYGDLVLRFYSDAACTIPVSVSNLTINLQERIWDEHSGSTTSSDFSAACNGFSKTVKSQTLMSVWNSAYETSTEHYYYLQTGTGYTVVISNQWPW